MDYSLLPEDISTKIATEHLGIFSPNCIPFSGVCKSWRSLSLRLHGGRWPPLPGLLMSRSSKGYSDNNPGEAHVFHPLATSWKPRNFTIPYFPSSAKMSSSKRRRYYNRLRKESVADVLNPDVDHIDDYNVFPPLTSKDGWMLCTLPSCCRHMHPLELYLLNPLTGASIPLPPLFTSYTSIHRALISSSPDADDDEQQGCYVFILGQTWSAWCKVSLQTETGGGWKFFDSSTISSRSGNGISDASYFGGKLYVLSGRKVHVIDHHRCDDNLLVETGGAIPFSDAMSSHFRCTITNRRDYHSFLCHVKGHAHILLFNLDDATIKVYKLLETVSTRRRKKKKKIDYEWQRVWSLDGHAVFIGCHQSFSLPAPSTAAAGYRADCIYFALDYTAPFSERITVYQWMDYTLPFPLLPDRARRNGVFDLAEGSVEGLASDHKAETRYGRPETSFWFLPMPWDMSSKLQKAKKQKYSVLQEDSRESSAEKRKY